MFPNATYHCDPNIALVANRSIHVVSCTQRPPYRIMRSLSLILPLEDVIATKSRSILGDRAFDLGKYFLTRGIFPSMFDLTAPNNIITNSDPPCAPGVDLSEHRKNVVGSVLDLFQGKPSLYKLSFWADDCVYEDPFVKSENREEVAGQFYGLPELVHSSVTEKILVTESSASTIRMDVVQVFTPKLLPESASVRFNTTMRIELDADEKIKYLEDRSKDRIPENSFIMLFRRANAIGTPKILGIPKTEQEDLERWKRWYGDDLP